MARKNAKVARKSKEQQYYDEDAQIILSGDKKVVIEKYAPLIRFIAQKIASRLPSSVELDDLISSGVIGLMDAIDKYDPNKENKFKTYAEFRIRGAILDELRSQDWVPRSVREKSKKVDKVFHHLERELGRQPQEREVAEELGISLDDYHLLMDEVKSVSVISLEDFSQIHNNIDHKNLYNFYNQNKSNNPLNTLTMKDFKQVVIDAINSLPEKQKLVLSLYYYEELNLKEIGQVLSVTESRVSQLHTQAIVKLKLRLKKQLEEVFQQVG
jgi:RNA polymerase sigma factor for flagellar operon FliA